MMSPFRLIAGSSSHETAISVEDTVLAITFCGGSAGSVKYSEVICSMSTFHDYLPSVSVLSEISTLYGPGPVLV